MDGMNRGFGFDVFHKCHICKLAFVLWFACAENQRAVRKQMVWLRPQLHIWATVTQQHGALGTGRTWAPLPQQGGWGWDRGCVQAWVFIKRSLRSSSPTANPPPFPVIMSHVDTKQFWAEMQN